MQERNLEFLTRQRDGKIYYAEQEQNYISCNGCVFNKPDVKDYNFCSCADLDMTEDCYYEQIIWKEKPVIKVKKVDKTKDEEPKFTVEQVLLAAGNCLREQPVFQDYDKIYATALEQITSDLMKHDDPDYKLYLQLKAKYDKV